jgi:CheY-like chemotaxis protein
MKEILKGKKILVVEDEEINWFLIRDILEESGVELTWAEIGIRALDLIKSGKKYDLVLMDINLPSLDGLEVTRQILKMQPDLPIVAQTAFAMDEEVKNAYEAGCCGHILKPFTIKELKDALLKVFTKEKS